MVKKELTVCENKDIALKFNWAKINMKWPESQKITKFKEIIETKNIFKKFITYQVCALGSWSVLPTFSIVNSWGPLLPYKDRNPFMGTRDVPVTNCSKRALISLLREYTAYIKKMSRIYFKLLYKLPLIIHFHIYIALLYKYVC